MENELPSEFDLIVLGTGFIESVIAAAASRVGKTVLHIDDNDYYGSLWASFGLDSFCKLGCSKPSSETPVSEHSGINLLQVNDGPLKLRDFSIQWHIPEKPDEISLWCQESLLQDSRKFNLDLVPKLHFARGDFVELLISSNVARYTEFRSVSRILTWIMGHLEIVPCSRSDVFVNNNVSVIEKRLLMKLLTSLQNNENFPEYDGKPFKTFLKDKKLTPNLIHFVMYAIAMTEDSTSCLDGIENTKRFLNSLGRFGKTPLLYSLYGSGEITQAFCRLSAVFGSIYALNQPIHGVLLDENNKAMGILSGNQRITSEHIVIGSDKVSLLAQDHSIVYISRAIFITNCSVLPDTKEHLSLMIYPPSEGKHLVIAIEAGTLTGVCPSGLYVIHLISQQSTSPKEDFSNCVRDMFNIEANHQILWSAYFSIPVIECELNSTSETNMYICDGPDLDLDYDKSVQKAKNIFGTLYPDLEFLPRAPDPEEIIIEGDDILSPSPDNTTSMLQN